MKTSACALFGKILFVLVLFLFVHAVLKTVLYDGYEDDANADEDESASSDVSSYSLAYFRSKQQMKNFDSSLITNESLGTSKSKLSGMPIVMFVTSKNITDISKSVESILSVTDPMETPILLSLMNPDSRLLKALSEYPVQLYLFKSSGKLKHKMNAYHHLVKAKTPLADQELKWYQSLNLNALVHQFRPKKEVCTKNKVDLQLNILTTTSNSTWYNLVHFDATYLNKENMSPQYDHPYNPLYRRLVMNSKVDENGKMSKEEIKNCKRANFIVETLEQAIRSYSKATHFFFADDKHHYSPDLVSYFSQLIPVFDIDSNVYCVATHNPLLSSSAEGGEDRVAKVGHFVGTGMTLVKKDLVKEIIYHFVIYEDKWRRGGYFVEMPSPQEDMALDWLETWLSWWSVRRRRTCVIPLIPRACLLAGRTAFGRPLKCSTLAHIKLRNITRLATHTYFQDMFYQATNALPYVGNGTFKCLAPEDVILEPKERNHILYIKMQSNDDDFTFYHTLKCFGIEAERGTAFYEGLFQFIFKRTLVYVFAVPYSTFAPAMIDGNLVWAKIRNTHLRDIIRYKDNVEKKFDYKMVPIVKET